MIFVTSGSMLPFDRLFQTIDDAVADGIFNMPVYGQIGEGKYKPKNFSFTRFIDKNEYDRLVNEAELVIGHAGIGVIMQALASNTKLLVMARKAEFGEHVNNHQVHTADKFEQLGHVLSFDGPDLPEKLDQVESFKPQPRRPDYQQVGAVVAEFLQELV